jgi:hypothetical protein
MLSNIGQLAITRYFLETYNNMHMKALHNAVENKDKVLHNVLVKIENSPELLLEQLTMRCSNLSADLIEMMKFDRLPITEAMFDLAYGENIDGMSPVAQIVAKAKVYVHYRSLIKANLINKSEIKFLFDSVKLSKKELSMLNKSDIDHIKLKFN